MGAQFGHIVTEETRRKIAAAVSNPSEKTRLRMRLAKLGKPSLRLIDITGQRFGQLVVICRGENKGQRIGWMCRCDCGNEVTIAATRLKRSPGNAAISCKLCGCKRIAAARTSHGMRHSPEYNSYNKAKARCNDPKNNRFARYGGRGIKFLFTSFAQFLAEVRERPEPKRDYSIERINNDGNYEPGNVRWATNEEQHQNSTASAAGMHHRWHVNRGIVKEGCALCRA